MKLKKSINISENVFVDIVDDCCSFNGPMGNITYKLHNFLKLDFERPMLSLYVNDCIFRKRDLSSLPAVFNTTYVMLKNCVHGVTNLFEYFLILKGIGYKVNYDSKLCVLTMLLGYSHPVVLNVPRDIFIELPSNYEIVVRSISKSRAGQFASDIRSVKVPEIYKGNGIRYRDEKIILKVPKKAK